MRCPVSRRAIGGCRTRRRPCRRGCSAMCRADGDRSLRRARRQDHAIGRGGCECHCRGARSGAAGARARESARTKLEAVLVQADVRDFRPAAPAPFVLLDAPCTATGTIRRHPRTALDQERLGRLAVRTGRGGIAGCGGADGRARRASGLRGVLARTEEGVEQVERFLERDERFAREAVTSSMCSDAMS